MFFLLRQHCAIKYFQVDCWPKAHLSQTFFVIPNNFFSGNEGKLAGNLQSSKGNLDQGSGCCTDCICSIIQETNLGFSNSMTISIGLHTSVYLWCCEWNEKDASKQVCCHSAKVCDLMVSFVAIFLGSVNSHPKRPNSDIHHHSQVFSFILLLCLKLVYIALNSLFLLWITHFLQILYTV